MQYTYCIIGGLCSESLFIHNNIIIEFKIPINHIHNSSPLDRYYKYSKMVPNLSLFFNLLHLLLLL